ncbi:fimbrial protein [Enterobacter wuhouensis]|uniref:fimbrial protein n=1 Tax=Enterobacter wuhouensis TaxID=2529381 RepID=UPI00352378BC
MAKLSIIALATLGLMMANSKIVAADTVNLNITGNVVSAPCIVNGGSGNINVNLGDIQASTLAEAYSASTVVPFDIRLSNCPNGISRVEATFTGTSDPVAGTSYYRSTGTAGNVAVALLTASTGTLKGNGTTSIMHVQTDRTASLPMHAKAYSRMGGASAGTIRSVVTLGFTYQ